MKVTHAYDDIIDLPHHQSSVHPHMPLADREMCIRDRTEEE